METRVEERVFFYPEVPIPSCVLLFLPDLNWAGKGVYGTPNLLFDPIPIPYFREGDLPTFFITSRFKRISLNRKLNRRMNIV